MFEPSVLNYFLLLLGGFGVVWSYRHTLKIERKIGEVEYAAFSTLWGIPLFIGFASLMEDKPELFRQMLETPMIASWPLFLTGVLIGCGAAYIVSSIREFGRK